MKRNAALWMALAMTSWMAGACGDGVVEMYSKAEGPTLSIMSVNGENCNDGVAAICSCPEGELSYQVCTAGNWSDCFCNNPEAEAQVDPDAVEMMFGGIFFSEYVEGSSNNKAIEVSNTSAKAAECTINLYSNGSTKVDQSVTFTIESNSVGAFCNASAAKGLKGRCFATSAVANFNGDDALELVCNGTTMDVFGHIGTRPKGKWTQNGLATADQTLRRKSFILEGRPNTDETFTALGTDWDSFPKDTFDGIGSHACDVTESTLDYHDQVATSDEATTSPTTPGSDNSDEGNTSSEFISPSDPGTTNPTTDPSTPEIFDPLPPAEPEPELTDWTFMVYMNGDNNLYEYAASDFKEMQRITSAANVNVIVLYDDYGANNTKLYRIKPSGKELLDSGKEIFSGQEADMGDYRTLKKFGVWAVTNYPAKKYALVMWNHGGGWRDNGASSIFKDFSNDENGTYNGILISNGNYANALSAISDKAGKKLDLVGFDACLMAMYEVAVASAPYADLLVGSEETEPANGWSYDYFLPLLSKSSDMNGLTLAKNIVDGYYKTSQDNATLSVTDLTTMNDLNTKLDAFADALIAAKAKSTLKTLRSGLFEFEVTDHVDLRQFVQSVAKEDGLGSTVALAANELDAQLGQTIAYEKAHNYYDSYYRTYMFYDNYTNGMAIYFPRTKVKSDWNFYTAGTWYKKTSWGSLVSSLW